MSSARPVTIEDGDEDMMNSWHDDIELPDFGKGIHLLVQLSG
jgi:hypothetical protein